MSRRQGAPSFVMGTPINRKTAEAKANNSAPKHNKAKRATTKQGQRGDAPTMAAENRFSKPMRSRIQRQTRKARTGGCK